MTSYLLTGPVGEPMTLAQIKAFLRVEDDAEDGLIEALLAAARIHVEGVTGRALLAQTWRVLLEGWPQTRVIRLPVSPLLELSEIRAYDAAGGVHQIDTDQFLPDGQAVPARIICPAPVAGSPELRDGNAIEIDYVAGFGTAPGQVPPDLVQSVRTLVAYWYENRDAVPVSGAGAAVPAGFERLVAPYRRVRL